jgi:predicted TIM-barrel fold metal-dependent hydrolase
MDEYRIQTQVLSVSEPGVYYLPTPAERLAMAQQLNNYTARQLIGTADPLLANRFGGFGVLPLGDPGDPADLANACAEARRIVLELNMDGVGLYSNYHGTYLGDPRLEPLMATLNELGAFVFVHPVTPSSYPDIGLPVFLYEFVFDTTRAAVSLLYHGVFDRYPNIRWLLAHAGGTVPFIAYRTSLLTLYPAIAQNLGLSGLDNQNLDYGRLFYDTALSPAASAMRSVRAVTDLSHIMFATDWPFSAPIFVVPGDPAPQLSDTFTDTERLAVERANALAQLPRLAARLGAA